MITYLIKKISEISLFKSAGIYTFANIINATIPFVLMPVLTRYLSPADYGIIATFQVLIGLVTPFVGVNIHGAVNISYFRKAKIDFPKYVSGCFVILVFTSAVVSILFILFKTQISNGSGFPENWLWTVIITCFSQFVISILLTIMQASVQPKIYSVLQICQTGLNLVLSTCLIVLFNYNWVGRVLGQVISLIIFALISIYILWHKKYLILSYDKSYIMDALKFGVPLIPHTIAGILMITADRIIITHFAGIEATGIYSVGVQISMAIALLTQSFNQAYSPWLFSVLEQINDRIKMKIVKLTYVYFIIIFIIAGVYSFVIPVLMKYLVGKEFYGANDIIVWLSFSNAFAGMYLMVVNYIFFIKKTYILACVTFVSSILRVVLIYVCVKFFGVIGAGYAAAIGSFIVFIVIWILSNRLYPMPWLKFFKNV